MAANPFESGLRKLVPATLVYLSTQDRILMLHREEPKDFHFGKWNAPGGKLELNESPLEGAKRELFEETGIGLPESAFCALGVLHFPNFKAQKSEDWIVFVFGAKSVGPENQPEPLSTSREWHLEWIERKKILSLELWPGDRIFLPHVLDRKPFVGTFWYEDGTLIRHWIQTLGQNPCPKI